MRNVVKADGATFRGSGLALVVGVVYNDEVVMRRGRDQKSALARDVGVQAGGGRRGQWKKRQYTLELCSFPLVGIGLRSASSVTMRWWASNNSRFCLITPTKRAEVWWGWRGNLLAPSMGNRAVRGGVACCRRRRRARLLNMPIRGRVH